MNRQDYLATAIRLFLAQPGAPPRASRNDWAVAQSLYARGADLADLNHAVRLATLRRLNRTGPCLPPIRSLAYYRQVLDQLAPDDLDPGYVAYIASTYARVTPPKTAPDPQNPALPDCR